MLCFKTFNWKPIIHLWKFENYKILWGFLFAACISLTNLNINILDDKRRILTKQTFLKFLICHIVSNLLEKVIWYFLSQKHFVSNLKIKFYFLCPLIYRQTKYCNHQPAIWRINMTNTRFEGLTSFRRIHEPKIYEIVSKKKAYIIREIREPKIFIWWTETFLLLIWACETMQAMEGFRYLLQGRAPKGEKFLKLKCYQTWNQIIYFNNLK